MFLLMLVSQPLISILLPEKWAPSIPLMQVLCISGAFSPFIILYYDLFNAVGRSDINLKMEIFKKIFFIIGILVCFKYSIMALMWLWVVYTLCSLIATMFLAHKYVNYTMGSFFFDIFPCFYIFDNCGNVVPLLSGLSRPMVVACYDFRNIRTALYYCGTFIPVRNVARMPSVI